MSTSEELYNDGKWRIMKEAASLPDGRMKTAVRVHRCDVSHILAFPTPKTILVLHEYRPFFQGWVWLLPSGFVDKETDPLEAAKRELREETGYRANIVKDYGSSYYSKSLVAFNHYYLATDLVKDPLPQDGDEMIEVHELPLNEAMDQILGSPQIHTPSAFGLLRYIREHPELV